MAEKIDGATGQLLRNFPRAFSHVGQVNAAYAIGTHLPPFRSTRRDVMRIRTRPAGPPAHEVRPRHGGIGRSSSPAAEAVSDALRRLDSPHLTARRRVAALQTLAVGALSLVGLYQFGLLRHLREPPLPGLDADAVDASGEAYEMLHTPDSTLGITSAGLTLILAGIGGADRARTHPLVPLALFAKTLVDAVGGAYLTAEQLTKHRRICSWCTISAAALIGSAVVAWPEARDALRVLRRHGLRSPNIP